MDRRHRRREAMDPILAGSIPVVGSAVLLAIVLLRPRRDWAGQNCSVLLVDMVGFGDPQRTDPDRAYLRDVMYQLVKSAFVDSGIRWRTCYREDRGDGTLFV